MSQEQSLDRLDILLLLEAGEGIEILLRLDHHPANQPSAFIRAFPNGLMYLALSDTP